MNAFKKSMTVLAIGGGSVAAWVIGSTLIKDVQYARAKEEVELSRQQLATIQDLSGVFRTIGKAVEPSVVNIEVIKSVKTGRQALPFDDDTLKRFFRDRNGDGQPDTPALPDVPDGFGDGGGPDDSPFKSKGTGSGVIMEFQGGSGFILTNNHVAGGATEIAVTLSDGRVIKGDKVKLLGSDAKTDLAVLKIDADRLIPAKWGDSDQLEKGDWVMAFGSPFGYIGSMTHGIVSALNRQAGILSSQQGYENFIQVDAPINPGNSGGPLVNVRGEVVGINTAIASHTGGFSGLGFAIPSNQAKFVYTSLKDSGKVVRGWLGVSIADVARDPGLAKSFGFPNDKGVLVQDTFANTPATGKLRRGDIITELAGKPVEDVQKLRNIVAATAPGNELKFKVWRDNKFADVTIKIGEQPENLTAVGMRSGRGGGAEPKDNPAAERNEAKLGLRLANPTDQTAKLYGLNDDLRKGALVTQVAPNSPAAKAGLRVGEVITRVGDQDVTSADEASAALAKADLTKGVRLDVSSPVGSKFVFIEPQ